MATETRSFGATHPHATEQEAAQDSVDAHVHATQTNMQLSMAREILFQFILLRILICLASNATQEV
eukprot:2273057-Amphidinium_carterae.2